MHKTNKILKFFKTRKNCDKTGILLKIVVFQNLIFLCKCTKEFIALLR